MQMVWLGSSASDSLNDTAQSAAATEQRNSGAELKALTRIAVEASKITSRYPQTRKR
jgi:hypothetical protein